MYCECAWVEHGENGGGTCFHTCALVAVHMGLCVCILCSHVCVCSERPRCGLCGPTLTSFLSLSFAYWWTQSVLSDPRTAAALRTEQTRPRPGQCRSSGQWSKFFFWKEGFPLLSCTCWWVTNERKTQYKVSQWGDEPTWPPKGSYRKICKYSLRMRCGDCEGHNVWFTSSSDSYNKGMGIKTCQCQVLISSRTKNAAISINVTLINSDITSISNYQASPSDDKAPIAGNYIWHCITVCLHSVLSSRGLQGKTFKCGLALLNITNMQLKAIYNVKK